VNGNIYLDQQRYAQAVVTRYLGAMNTAPTEEEKVKYRYTQPVTMTWTKADCSPNAEAIRALESSFGFRYI
jgi:hypothetical protein